MKKERGVVLPVYLVVMAVLVAGLAYGFWLSSLPKPGSQADRDRSPGQMTITKSPEYVLVILKVIDFTGDTNSATKQALCYAQIEAQAWADSIGLGYVVALVENQPRPYGIFDHVLDRQNTFVITYFIWL